MLVKAMSTALRPASFSMFKHIDLSMCLRCQYPLSLQQGPRSGRGPRSSRRGPTVHPQQLRRFTSGPVLQQEQHDTPSDNGKLEGAPVRYLTENRLPHPDDSHGKARSAKNSLGLNVLGEPAEVLILRDRPNTFRPDPNLARVSASAPHENPAQEPITSSKMLEVRDTERGTIDIDEVCENIEILRKMWAARMNPKAPGAAYKDLFSRLQNGFTRPQLGAYLDRAKMDPAADVLDLHVEFSNRVYARSKWQAVMDSPPQQTTAPMIVRYTPIEDEKEIPGKKVAQGLSKDALVKRVLRQCWKITSSSQGSSSGVLDIRLKKLHLNLILNHSKQRA